MNNTMNEVLPGVLYAQLLYLGGGVFLLTAVLVLWRRELAAVIRLMAAQGMVLAGLVALLGIHRASPGLVAGAVLIFGLRGLVLPYLMRRVLATSGTPRENGSVVNVAASLVAAAALVLIAYAVSQPLVALAPSAETQAVPVAVTVVLLGFFVLVTRRHALSQVVGLLMLDNGIAMTAFLTAQEMPMLVELGVSLDLLLIVVVLHVLVGRMRRLTGSTDLGELRELRG